MRKGIFTSVLSAFMMLVTAGCVHAQQTNKTSTSDDSIKTSKVYMFREINSENLVGVYEALEREAIGKVAVKVSTGEPGGHNFLNPQMIKALVQKVNGTIVECNTAYGSRRSSTEAHLKTATEHGFIAIAPVVIMDADGETKLPLKNGRHLKYDIVGEAFLDYDFTIILSHFKGHAMGGFGGAIKNMSIGIASARQFSAFRNFSISMPLTIVLTLFACFFDRNQELRLSSV